MPNHLTVVGYDSWTKLMRYFIKKLDSSRINGNIMNEKENKNGCTNCWLPLYFHIVWPSNCHFLPLPLKPGAKSVTVHQNDSLCASVFEVKEPVSLESRHFVPLCAPTARLPCYTLLDQERRERTRESVSVRPCMCMCISVCLCVWVCVCVSFHTRIILPGRRRG